MRDSGSELMMFLITAQRRWLKNSLLQFAPDGHKMACVCASTIATPQASPASATVTRREAMFRRTFLSQFLMLVGASIIRTSSVRGTTGQDTTPDTVRKLASAAAELLQGLQPESRKELEFAFEDIERKKWSNVPNAVLPVALPLDKCPTLRGSRRTGFYKQLPVLKAI
jgi:hypothetical protein